MSADETELSWAGRLLHRLRRSTERPSAAEDSAMNTLMICQCLTEMRPACFTARFAASATTDILAALQSAATVFGSNDDLRADILAETVLTLLGSADRIRLAGCAARLEKVLAANLFFPTADWVSTKVMTLLDIPPERQAIVIGMARLVGWSAQAIEQQASGHSLLPRLNYGEPEMS